MISFKDKTKFVLATLILILTSNLVIANDCFAGPLRRLANMERNMQKPKLVMYSSAFKNGERIPTHYTADDANVSPPLSWGTPPTGTKSFALICEDPDAPMGTFIHWIIYDIPADKKGLQQGVSTQPSLPDGTKQGTTSFHKIGYGGPAPPPGKPHRYFFKLYALDSMFNLPNSIDAKQFHSFVSAHTLGEADLLGTYGR
jgi:Raf kinase inhibitor-like YbhB/YbcL family protein